MDDLTFIFSILKDSIGKIHSQIYQPTILIADGAEQITNAFSKVFGPNFVRVMCWANVEREIETRLKFVNNTSIAEEILSDINHIRLSYCADIFKFLTFLYFQKWSQLNAPNINNFLEYFRKKWVDSSNNGWYEGICLSVPSTNNGSEANNGGKA